MRIGIIAPFHQFGGSEHQILLLLRGLQQQGVEFVLFHLNIQAPELLEELKLIPGCIHYEFRLRSVRNIFLFSLDVLKVAKQLQYHECELVHAWNYTGHIIGGISAKLAQIPCIFSIGGLDPWKKVWQLPIYRLLNRLVDRFVFQSVTERDIVSQREWIPLKQTLIIPNGVDQQRFHILDKNKIRNQICQELNLHPALPLVLSVGSLRIIKGHDILIEAVRRIREERPDLPFHVVIVGDGPFRESYEQSAHELPIIFMGFRKDVERFYLATDLYCQPSRSEGLPNAVIEAMCCGLPIIASDVGGVVELVTLDNGLLFKSGDSEALARRLHELLLNLDVWPMMGAASLRLSERFSSENMVDSYISTYKRILSET